MKANRYKQAKKKKGSTAKTSTAKESTEPKKVGDAETMSTGLPHPPHVPIKPST